MSIEEKLVDDWHELTHWWSVRWAAIGAVVLPAINLIPATLPPEAAALFPPSVRAIISCIWCLGYIVLRVMAQKKPGA